MKKKSLFLILLSVAMVGCNNSHKEVTPPHTHTPSQTYSFDENDHWKVCTSCKEVIDKEIHSFSDWLYDSDDETTITYRHTCSTCTYSNTKVEEKSDDQIIKYDVSKYYDGYYSSLVSWDNSEDLTNKLYNLLRNGYTPLSYGDPNWESNQFADEDLYLTDSVDVLYSNKSFLKTNTNQGWQREHAFAASLMTGFTSSDAVGALGRATDFHNLFASYATGNTSRNNKNFGIANPNDAGYQSVGSGKGVYGDYSCDTKVFEPSNYDKGRVARAIFYMGVMYSKPETNVDVSTKLNYSEEDQKTYGKQSQTVHFNMNYEPLTIIEDDVPYSKITYTNWYYETTDDIKEIKSKYSGTPEETYAQYSHDNCQFAIGHKSTLLDWAKTYTVDMGEMKHNESVYSHIYTKREAAQGNRNPFIDYPGLIDYVYGNKKDLAGNLNIIKPVAEILKTNTKEVSHYALKDIDREYAVNDVMKEGTSYKVLEVYKDLSSKEIVTELNADYKFIDSDVGEKEITIKTPGNDIKFTVNVSKAGNSESSWKHVLSGYNGDFQGKNVADTIHEVEMDGISWNVYWKEGEIGSANSSPSYGGVKWGKNASSPVKELKFETKDEFTYNSLTNIATICFEGNVATGCSYDYVIKVNDTVIKTSQITYSADPKIKEYSVDLSTPLKGKISIEFTNITNAIYINSLGVVLTNN